LCRLDEAASPARIDVSSDLDAFDPKGTYGAAARDYAEASSRWQFLSDRALAGVNLRAGDRVLDVACGPGGTALAAASLVGSTGEVTAVDIAPQMLEIVRERAAAAGLTNVTLVEADMSALDSLPVGSPTFDAVVCVLGLFFANDMVQAARSMWNRVAPQGRLVVTTLGTEVFAPMLEVFMDAATAECPSLDVELPWRRTEAPTVVIEILREAGVSTVDVHEETGRVSVDGLTGWWSLVIGSGLRRVVTEVGPDAAARIRSRTEAWMAEHELTSVTMTGVHFTSLQKP
jgi:SAM-dependent methyltransferase